MPWWSLKASPPDPSEVRPAVTSPGNQLRPITYRDMAFVRTDDTYWVEGVTMTCFLENGDFVLYSFVVSSIPFNKHKATLNLKINKHDGSPPVYYQQSVTMDRLNFSKDLTSAEFEDGCYFKYDDVHKAFECCTINDNSEKTQELFHGAKFIKIRFVSDVKTGIQLGGRVPEAKEVLENPDQYYQYPPAEHPSNFTFAKEGKFWRQANFPVGSVVISTDTNEVLAKGTGYLGRIATNVALHHFSSSVRHIKVFSEDRRMSLFLVDVQTTEKYAFNKICIAGLQRDGKILMVTQQSEFKHLEEPTVDPITGYKPPRKYMVSFNGPSVDGDSHVHCSLEIAPKKFMERIHVLGNQLFAALLASATTTIHVPLCSP